MIFFNFFYSFEQCGIFTPLGIFYSSANAYDVLRETPLTFSHLSVSHLVFKMGFSVWLPFQVCYDLLYLLCFHYAKMVIPDFHFQEVGKITGSLNLATKKKGGG